METHNRYRKKKTVIAKLVVVVGAIFVIFGAGSIYCWGTLSVYVSSPGFFEHDNSSMTSLCYAVAMFMEPYAMLLGAWCERKTSPRTTALIAAVLVSGGWLLSALGIHVVFLAFTYGILSGVGAGIGVVCSLTTVLRHFSETTHGILSGVVLSAFSIGSLSFGLVVESAANPHHIPANYDLIANSNSSYSTESQWAVTFHESAVRNVPIAMVCCAVMSGVTMIIGALLLRNPKIPVVHEKELDEAQVVVETLSSYPPENEKTPRETIRTIAFWKWFVAVSFFATAELYVIRAFAEFAVTDCEFNVRYDLVGGTGAVMMIAGRFFWGKICDVFGYRPTVATCATVAAVAMTVYFDTYNNKIGYVATTIVLFLSFSGLSVSIPKIVGCLFGQIHFATNYALMDISYTVAAVIQAIVPSLLLEKFGSHRAPFYFMAMLSAATAIIASFS